MKRIIIMDASGSMAEEGKKTVAVYLVHTVCDLLRNEWGCTEYSVYTWNREIELSKGKIDCKGKTDEDKLEEFLEQNKDSRVLVISDCRFSKKGWKTLEDEGVLLLKVGSENISAGVGNAFRKRNIFEAVDAAECTYRFANN